MTLQFLHRSIRNAKRVALFPGAWNPPTVAHVEIARAALAEADEVVWVLPRALPHKPFDGATFDERCGMLHSLARVHAAFSVATSEGGLYAEIAAEAREYFAGTTEILFVLGKDAAERIASWDYGTPGVFDDFARRYRLLVAARNGEYEPEERHRGRISRLLMDAAWNEVSSSEVRRRVALGENWRDLVHPAIADTIEGLYAGTRETDNHRSAEHEPRPDSQSDRRADTGAVGVPHRRGPLVDRGVRGARHTRGEPNRGTGR